MKFDEYTLAKLGFKKIKEQKGKGFGDFCEEYEFSSIGLRYVSDRRQKYLDLCRLADKDWFDIPLIAFCLDGEGEDILSFEKQYEFLTQRTTAICEFIISKNGSKLLGQARDERQRRRLGLS